MHKSHNDGWPLVGTRANILQMRIIRLRLLAVNHCAAFEWLCAFVFDFSVNLLEFVQWLYLHWLHFVDYSYFAVLKRCANDWCSSEIRSQSRAGEVWRDWQSAVNGCRSSDFIPQAAKQWSLCIRTEYRLVVVIGLWWAMFEWFWLRYDGTKWRLGFRVSMVRVRVTLNG